MVEVPVPYGDKPGDTAVLLLAAAEDLGFEPWVVRTTTDRQFMVPEEVQKKAFAKPTAKKAAPAKKASAKKSEE